MSWLPVDVALEPPAPTAYDPDVPGWEVRRFERIPCDHRAEIEVWRSHARTPVTVRTLSLGGMGLTFDEWEGCDIESGARITVTLQLGERAVDLPAYVAWCRPCHTKRYDLGVALDLDRADRGARDTYIGWVRGAL